MSKLLDLQCCECDTKKKFVDVRDIKFQNWRVIGWNVSTAQPIIACNKCVLPWEKSTHKQNFDGDKIEEVIDKPKNKVAKKVSKKKKPNEKKRIQKRNK